MSCEDFYCMFCGLLGTAILLGSAAYSVRHRRPLEQDNSYLSDDYDLPDVRAFQKVPKGAIHVYDSVHGEEFYMITQKKYRQDSEWEKKYGSYSASPPLAFQNEYDYDDDPADDLEDDFDIEDVI